MMAFRVNDVLERERSVTRYEVLGILECRFSKWKGRILCLEVGSCRMFLCSEVHDIVQEVVIKTIPKKKAKWLSEEGLQIADKRREARGKGEKERYTHLNAEFQRIAWRVKKAFLSKQCKEIEENNRMGKTRDLFKKIRYQGNISCKDGHNKGQKWYGPNRSRRY